MRFTLQDARRMLLCSIAQIEKLPDRKGSCCIVYRGKPFFVWKAEPFVFIQGNHFWSRTHRFLLSDIHE